MRGVQGDQVARVLTLDPGHSGSRVTIRYLPVDVTAPEAPPWQRKRCVIGYRGTREGSQLNSAGPFMKWNRKPSVSQHFITTPFLASTCKPIGTHPKTEQSHVDTMDTQSNGTSTESEQPGSDVAEGSYTHAVSGLS